MMATKPHKLLPSGLVDNYWRSLCLRWHCRKVGDIHHLFDNGRCVLTTGQDLEHVQRFIDEEVAL